MNMIKMLLAFAFLALGTSAKAQVENLDEVELLGTWEYVSGDGIFTGRLPIYNNSYRKPVGFTFNDNQASVIKWEYVGESYDYQQYGGYWVSHTSERYILHILSDQSYSSGETRQGDITTINFVVTKFANGEMILQTLSGDGTLSLKKQTASSVSSVETGAKSKGKAYTLNGVETSPSTKGIVIQDGKKRINR